MSKEILDYNSFNHDEYARSRPRDDFWGQIRRTVQGKSVDEQQIQLIVDTIIREMQFTSRDHVLDICCGNGALSSRFTGHLSKLIGIDNSEYLISIAKEFFEDPPTLLFHQSEINEHMHKMQNLDAARITKLLCYGSFSYLDEAIIRNIFNQLNTKFTNVSHFYIGNIPDKSKAGSFFFRKTPINLDLSSHSTTIGRWWKKAELIDLAKANMWSSCIINMSDNFYGSAYRFDALLTRKPLTDQKE